MVISNDIKPFNKFVQFAINNYHLYGIGNIKELYVLLEGYRTALLTHTIHDSEMDNFKGFDDFVKNRFKVDLTIAWYEVIEDECSDDLEGIVLFKKLFDEFIG